MSSEVKKEIQLGIAHVLFIDIVGYSKVSTNDQHAAVEELKQIVRASEQSQRAEAASRMLKIPTGDGMALVVDVNERASLAGAGINMAQRVMDCGDAGHILLSKHVAEDLEEYE